MHVVTETSESDVAHARAFPEVAWALRDLTANLMRVAAGAGASYEIFRQIPALAEALNTYRDTVGHYPSSWDLDRALDPARGEDLHEREINEHWYTLQAECDVVVGSLRAAASRLLFQQVQVMAGERRMNDGVNALFRLRREREERWRAEEKAAASKSARKSATRKKATNRKPKGTVAS